ncbi:hypothetical protein AB0M86_46220 [Streptomyces sp. NPDC051639]|uniref:hypothetical protein n=1 Tax=Streptomyces sp. NPDC051639 TaxID=3155671 RepID=UPI003423964E
MFKKSLFSAALAASVMVGVCFTADTASAASQASGGIININIPGGVYPSLSACFNAGNAGLSQGRWVAFRCQDLGGGQRELWVGV